MFRDKEISEEEYYHSILAHCTGYLHDEDDDEPSPARLSSLQWDDAFAYAVECFMKRKDFVKDIAPFEDAFRALVNQNLRTIEEAMAKLEDQHAKFLRKILALRALQLRKAEVLRYCLEVGGFPYEAYFEDEANSVQGKDDPLTFKVLEESHFRKVYPRKERDLTGDMAGDDDGMEMEGEEDMSEGDDFAGGIMERESRERDAIAATFDKGGTRPVDW